ncbi:hypothetical protein GB931_17235 [Modestobacter sp. I12A-02628]|uniref:histidine kinase n=1 Tax=Goekera deserti TaxID=2497753 RepID=A0A7K3WE81_9ACTN|nr:histidine kinase dimerization/phosphoacceptor domain-containing protein [Goekera deserti]MPQ99629.1 hypothetical protein [Goekera deserti]NDI46361.1 hypothetical protein [Goekera deserti]NEL54707.1 histidine kinase [Goekera deserti]
MTAPPSTGQAPADRRDTRPSGGAPLPWAAARGRRGCRHTWLLTGVAVLYVVLVLLAASDVVATDQQLPASPFLLLAVPAAAGTVLTVRAPVAGWALVTACLVMTPFLLQRPGGGAPVVEAWGWCLWVPTLLAVGWARPRRTGLLVGAGSLLVVVLLRFGAPVEITPGHLQVSLLGVALVVLVGISLGVRWDAGRALAVEQQRTEEALAQRGALAERARIAREMHDVVAHELSAIAVRAETAPYRVAGLSPEAREELAATASTARRALTELQQLLGVLRAEDQQADRRPAGCWPGRCG